MKTRNKKGFTLIELLAVVLIIAILTAIGLPAYQRSILRSRTAEVNNLLTMVRTRQAREFALNKKYAESFNNTTLSKITLHSTEVNNGLTKVVNDDYELELRNLPATENTPASNCIIGRYKPDNDTKFTLAIAYTKNGLACQDGNISWSVCDSLGTTVVSNNIDEVCAGEAPGQTTCPEECGECYYQNPDTCECVENTTYLSVIGNNNWEFNASVGEERGCKSCKYCEGEDCPADKKVVWEIDTTAHAINAFPIPANFDEIFECTDPAAALGDLTEVGCALYDATSDDQECLTPTYNCHSAYFKRWNTEPNCGWICQAPTENICGGDQAWNNNTCSCTCRPGTRCLCHITQQYIGGGVQNCRCLAGEEADFISQYEDPGCVCRAREDFGELQGERVLITDKTHCKCGTDREEVFFGKLTDPRGGTHDINIPDWQLYIEEDRFWEAACCLHDEVWHKDQIKGFDYDVCCPIVKDGYTKDSTIRDVHLEFDVSQRKCCQDNEPFYHYTDQNGTPESLNNGLVNSQYTGRSSGSYQANICHKCEEWFHAYSDEIGCYACPGKTFTTWNDSPSAKVSECSCPTGTTPEGAGAGIVIENGIATENCECKKGNTHWDISVQWISTPNTRTAWHVNNGACKCNINFFDTYYGLEIEVDPVSHEETIGSKISYNNGFCCPTGYETPVTDADNVATGETACCPANKPFFHKTDFANNTCGVCQNHTHTYVNNQCQACPAGMYPVYNESLGYALCDCPTGTQAIAGTNNLPLATETNVCECKLPHSTWQAPTNEDWVTPYINSQTMPGNWSSINGYCDCKAEYTFADHGVVGSTTITTDGYCCHTPTGSLRPTEGWHTSNANPPEKFCCNANVAFNPEFPNAQCCTTNYYYNLDTLNSATNNLNATLGGCGACSDPKKTWIQTPSEGQPNCQDCEYPKIPSWNNSPSFGYSVCSCPAGSIEVTDQTQPSWWQRFLALLGISKNKTQDPNIGTAVSGHCQCVDENSIWVNGVCQCPTGFTNQYTNGECCPTDKPYYWEDTGNFSSNPAQRCHKCPSGQYEYDSGCHECPQGQYYVDEKCCNENISSSVSVYIVEIDGVEHCSVCEQGKIYAPDAEDGPCITPPSEGCEYGVNAYGVANCECENGAIWTPENGCSCQENDAQCNCNQCMTNNPGENVVWQLVGSGFSSTYQCGCDLGRVFNNSCCTNPDLNCCSCPTNTTETLVENTPDNSGCCPNARAHVNAAGQSICCPASTPYYVNGQCSLCQENYYYNTDDQRCERCSPPNYNTPGNWTPNLSAYTSCDCPAGTSRTGQGGYITTSSNTNMSNPGAEGHSDRTEATFFGDPAESVDGTGGTGGTGGTTTTDPVLRCRCLYENMIWDSNTCVCASGYSLLDSNNQSCSQADGNNCKCRQCPSGTMFYSALGKCAKCYNPDANPPMLPANYYVSNGNCLSCLNITIVNTAEENWDDNLHGYKPPCVCPTGAGSTTNSGEVIQYTLNDHNMNSSCKCPTGQHYTDDNYYATAYQSGASCKACPSGTTWEIDSSTGTYHCACPTGFTFQNGKCECVGYEKHSISSVNLKACDPAVSSDCVCAACPNIAPWCDDAQACLCINSIGSYTYQDDTGYHTVSNLIMTGSWAYETVGTYDTRVYGNISNHVGVAYNSFWFQGTNYYCSFSCQNRTTPVYRPQHGGDDLHGGSLDCQCQGGPGSVCGEPIPANTCHDL